MSIVHPTAVIDPSAEIASNVTIGPYSIIGKNVVIDEDTWVGPHVVINGSTKIGKRNRIFQFASVGEECQDLKYKGEDTRLIIGNDNTIREGVTLHRGTVQDKGETRIGDRCLFMAYTHVAHDCIIGNEVIMANYCGVAGHCEINDNVILGGHTGVHQFCRVGAHAFIGVSSVVLKDVPAFVRVRGYPASPHGMNIEGLKRRQFSENDIRDLRRAYKIVYRESRTLSEAIEVLQSTEVSQVLKVFIDSILESKRGIVR